MLLAEWACGQLLLGRQFQSDREDRVVGLLQAYMAWGQAIMDRTPFGESLRALPPPSPALPPGPMSPCFRCDSILMGAVDGGG